MWLILQNVIAFLPYAYVIPEGNVRSYLAAKFHPNPIWNDGVLCLFEDGCVNKKQQEEQEQEDE